MPQKSPLSNAFIIYISNASVTGESSEVWLAEGYDISYFVLYFLIYIYIPGRRISTSESPLSNAFDIYISTASDVGESTEERLAKGCTMGCPAFDKILFAASLAGSPARSKVRLLRSIRIKQKIGPTTMPREKA